MLPYCQLESQEQTYVNFEWGYGCPFRINLLENVVCRVHILTYRITFFAVFTSAYASIFKKYLQISIPYFYLSYSRISNSVLSLRSVFVISVSIKVDLSFLLTIYKFFADLWLPCKLLSVICWSRVVSHLRKPINCICWYEEGSDARPVNQQSYTTIRTRSLYRGKSQRVDGAPAYSDTYCVYS